MRMEHEKKIHVSKPPERDGKMQLIRVQLGTEPKMEEVDQEEARLPPAIKGRFNVEVAWGG